MIIINFWKSIYKNADKIAMLEVPERSLRHHFTSNVIHALDLQNNEIGKSFPLGNSR